MRILNPCLRFILLYAPDDKGQACGLPCSGFVVASGTACCLQYFHGAEQFGDFGKFLRIIKWARSVREFLGSFNRKFLRQWQYHSPCQQKQGL
ncbi:hypothetical protein [Paenibacillus farraposensis]